MDINQTSAEIGKRYVIRDEIGRGGMGVVYRTTDRLTGQLVALKCVTAPSDLLIFASRSDSVDLRISLAHEFQMLASLHHPNIIGVLDYGFDTQRQAFFTMELLENPVTILQAGKNKPVSAKVELILQMLQALLYLHRRGIIHRDLKPNNVLVANDQVRVLDFGLSTRPSSERREGETAGTLAYMAPEVLQQGLITEAADLYSVGMIAYELFTDQHPFNTASISKLITEILTVVPQVPVIADNYELTQVVQHLLEKDPDARLADVAEAIVALSKAIGQPIPQETTAIRESFLQSARLVGRDSELAQMLDVVKAAIASSGSAWLIAGESGVGKSRFMSELRTLASIHGATVVRGQAVSEGSSLYQVWRDVLRWLSLIVDLTAEEASVLKALVPDIGVLIEQDVADAPELDPKGTQERLFKICEAILQRLNQGIVIILEDLQWAGSESIEMLTHLSSVVKQLPALILGSYRDDEKPDMPKILPQMQVLKLARLSQSGIAELSESMLGKVGRQEQVLHLLQQETEGNVFFLVEVVRALAEEVGKMELIGTKSLPKHIFTGSVQQIVQRRLNRLPPHDYPLLQTAAVIGRQIDLSLLGRLAPDTNLDQWLTICSDGAILNFQDERWHFAHDRLREGVLSRMNDDARKAVNGRVAEALEGLYGADESYTPALAYHFFQAEVWEKAFTYLIKAGDAAVKQYAAMAAYTHYTDALSALSHLPENPENQRRRIDTVVKQASASYTFLNLRDLAALLGQMEELAKTLPASTNPVDDTLRMARIHLWRGRVHYYGGETREAVGYFRQVLAVAEQVKDPELLAIPSGVMARVLGNLGQFAKSLQLAQQAAPALAKSGVWTDWIWAHGYIGIGNAAAGNYAKGLALAEEARDRAITMNYQTGIEAAHTILFYITVFGDDRERMLEEASAVKSIAEQTGERLFTYLGHGISALAESRLGRHDAALRSMAMSETVGNELGARLILIDHFKAFNAEIHLNARRFEEAVTLGQNAAAYCKEAGSLFAGGIAWRALGVAQASLDVPRWDEAESSLATAVQLCETSGNVLEVAHCHRAWGIVCQKRGNEDEARLHLERAISRYETSGLTAALAIARPILAELSKS